MFDFLKKPKNIGICVGSVWTYICYGEIEDDIICEPSHLAMLNDTMIAVGSDAQELELDEGILDEVRLVEPCRSGVISDCMAFKLMLRGFLNHFFGSYSIFGKKFNLSMTLVLPCAITGVELNALRNITKSIGRSSSCFVFAPLAAAVGIGIDIMNEKGSLIVDIDLDYTEVSFIASGGIVATDTIRMNLAAVTDKEEKFRKISDCVKSVLRQTPAEYKEEFGTKSAYIIGNTSYFEELETFLFWHLGIWFKQVKDPGLVKAKGAHCASLNRKRFPIFIS